MQHEVVWHLPPQGDTEGPQLLHLLHSIAPEGLPTSTPYRVRGTRTLTACADYLAHGSTSSPSARWMSLAAYRPAGG